MRIKNRHINIFLENGPDFLYQNFSLTNSIRRYTINFKLIYCYFLIKRGGGKGPVKPRQQVRKWALCQFLQVVA